MLAVALGLFGCTSFNLAASENLHVVATISPVHSLVSAVTSGVVEPSLIIRGNTSPHDFSMRPSDARKLANADVVFLIGESVETSIFQGLDALAADAKVVQLAQVEGVIRRRLRDGGSFEETHDHSHGSHHEGHEDEDAHADSEDEEAYDMHVWLDPVNAKAMAQAVTVALSQADPANAHTYNANFIGLHRRLSDLSAEIESTVAPLRGNPFLVFHDAYLHFEERFGLAAAGSAVVSTDRSPSVRRIRELRTKVRDLGIRCVMSEPQFDPRRVHVIVQGTDATIGSIDPLGGTLESGPELYFTLLRNMATSFKKCLSP